MSVDDPRLGHNDRELRMLRDVRRAAAEQEHSVAMVAASEADVKKQTKVASRGGAVGASSRSKKQKPNERCACGSGRKHKKCCGAAA
jgi:uncharacterized protein YecA (UPF0149 family)